MPPTHVGCFCIRTYQQLYTAPCRVSGNAPGSSASKTLTTRSAVLLCLKLLAMETTTINAGNVQTHGAFPLKESAKAKINSVNLWLNAKSQFYSNICQYSVSRRTVLRVNMVTAAMLVGAVCVEQAPVVAVVAMAVAAWLTAALKRQSN